MINEVKLIGHVGGDKQDITGGIKFTVATSYSIKENGEWKDKTTWHDIVMFGTWAEDKRIMRGDMVYVSGRLDKREYEGKTYVNIVADRVRVLKRKDDTPF